MNNLIKNFTRRKIVLGAIFSMLFSFVFTFGRKINYEATPMIASFTPMDLVQILGITVLCLALFLFLDWITARKYSTLKPLSIKGIFILTGILLLTWLPWFLTYYPANLTPDSLSSIRQALGIVPLYNHHPIVYTLFIMLFMKIGMLFGDVSVGVAVAMFAQMIVMAGILGYFLWWLWNHKAPRWLVIFAVLFFTINPAIGMYAMTMWKDVMFSGWVLLLCMHLFDLIQSKGELLHTKMGIVKLVFLCLLVAFARNNGLYVVVFTMLITLLIYRKMWKRIGCIALALLVGVSLVQGPLYGALGIENSGFAESVAIPLQQIGYTVAKGEELTAEQTEKINHIMPLDIMKENYNPKLVDNIKFNKAFQADYLNENKGEFIGLWFSMMPSHFKEYVEAYLLQTNGYWNLGTSYRVCKYGIIDNEFGVKGTVFTNDVMYQSHWPDKLQDISVVGNIYNIGYMVWFVFAAIFILWGKKRGSSILALVPLVGIWGTMMIAAPLYCDLRYMYAFHLGVPFILFTLFHNKTKNID